MSSVPPPPFVGNDVESTPKIEAVQAELRALLAKSFKGATTEVRAEKGPLGLAVITAAIPHAYPGSGVLRVLIDDRGTTYGVHGEQDLAELVRAHRWNHEVPDLDALIRLINAALFEGVAMLMDAPAPSATAKDGTLVVQVDRAWHPSGARSRVTVTVGPVGNATVSDTFD